MAAVNGPGSVTVAGEVGALEVVLAECAGEGVRARLVGETVASHSCVCGGGAGGVVGCVCGGQAVCG